MPTDKFRYSIRSLFLPPYCAYCDEVQNFAGDKPLILFWSSCFCTRAGSVRVPASFCGILGIRPTHGRVSMEGSAPLGKSFDTCKSFFFFFGLNTGQAATVPDGKPLEALHPLNPRKKRSNNWYPHRSLEPGTDIRLQLGICTWPTPLDIMQCTGCFTMGGSLLTWNLGHMMLHEIIISIDSDHTSCRVWLQVGGLQRIPRFCNERATRSWISRQRRAIASSAGWLVLMSLLWLIRMYRIHCFRWAKLLKDYNVKFDMMTGAFFTVQADSFAASQYSLL